MPTFAIIAILVGIGVLAAVGFLFQIANMRGSRNRGRRRDEARSAKDAAAQRRGDVRALTGPEKRLHIQAKTLLAEGKVQAAARILEQLNMQREAIQALEDAGMIHEGAKILMRMGKHNRAGVIYARHGMWLDAASSFKMAQMPLEVAKCAREAGRFDLAAEFFEKAGRFDDAGECFEKLGDFHKAAKFFGSAGNRERSMAMYDKLAVANADAAAGLDADELKAIVEHLSEGRLSAGLNAIVVQRSRSGEVISALIGSGLSSQARELYDRTSEDIGPQLMSDVSYQDKAAELLAQLFLSAEHFHYAGMVFERMSSFARAGAAFEQAEDFERAAYCFERGSQDERARAMKEKARRAAPPAPGARASASGFALSNLPNDSRSAPMAFQEREGDSTAMIDASGAATTPPPRPAVPASAPPPPPRPAAPAFSLAADEGSGENDAHAAPASLEDDDAPPASGPPLRIVSGESARKPGAGASEPGNAAFHRAKFLADLDSEQKNALWAIGRTQDFDDGEVVLTYDDEPKGVYIIVSGTVSCYRNVGGTETYVDQMSASETFGELWLLADQPTAVRFVAQASTQIRVIARDDFNELMDKDGTLARKVYKRFTLRLLKRLLKPQSPSKNQAAS